MFLKRIQKLAVVLPLLVTALVLAGCAGYIKRKECEKTDWYDYGRQKALSGSYLSGDNFIRECSEAEGKLDEGAADRGFKEGREKFCSLEHAQAVGKAGALYTPGICDGMNLKKLTDRHQTGVKEYCRKDNGYPAGQKGTAYNQICPDDMEKAFLPEFNRGRKVWLTSQINGKSKEIDDIDRDIEGLNREKNNLQGRVNNLNSSKKIVRESKLDPATNTYREETSLVEDDNVKNERSRLTSDMDSLDRRMSDKREDQRKLRASIRDMQTELAGL